MSALLPSARRLVFDRHKRWLAYGILAVVLVVLSLFPQPYVSRAKVVPGDSGANGLVGLVGAMGGQAQNLASLFGDRSATDVALAVAKSEAVTSGVIDRLRLVGPDAPYASKHAAQLALHHRVDVHSLTGGILEVEVKAFDPDWALKVTEAYVAVISERLGIYGRAQIDRKKRIVTARISTARARLAAAETALSEFRRRNNLADPQAQLGSQLSLRTNLEGQLQARLVELSLLRETAGPDNIKLRVVETSVEALRRQIAQTAQPAVNAAGPNISGVSAISLQYVNLFRDFTFAQAIYEVYSRSAEEVAVQELVTQSATDIATVDAPHIDPDRHYNIWAVAALGALLFLAFFVEFYAPMTGLFELAERARGDGRHAGPHEGQD